MKRIIFTALIIFTVLTFFLGIVYPLTVWIISHVLFPLQADGTFIMRHGQVIGSRLIGQPFTEPGYFHPRPSAVNYDVTASGASNLAPSNRILIDRLRQRIDALSQENPAPVPLDMVTASASGLDPHISVASSRWQVARISRNRGIDEPTMVVIINRFTERPWLGFIGEARVNVLLLNLYLDERLEQGMNHD
jgi:K+-transporting ATPase ATPase C chain